MKIMFLGDIVGRPGRRAVLELLKGLRAEFDVDFVVANGENLTTGKGFNTETIEAMRESGVDFFTMGNHVFANKDGIPLLDDNKMPIIRPANIPDKAPGVGYKIVDVTGKKLLIVNLIAPHIFHGYAASPFETIDRILIEDKGLFDFALVDFHAQYTSDKMIMAWYLDGRVNAVVGTHTHVPTADAKVLPKGTAFITDVGMSGLKWSSLGVDIEPLIEQAIIGLPQKHVIGGGPAILSAVVVDMKESGSTIEQVLREVE